MTAEGSDRSFGAPRFDVVLRGYDRRQVDEHLSRLNRVLARLRGDLESARSRPLPPPATGPLPPPGARPRPTPRRRPDGTPGEPDDVVGTFTDRMKTILQAAEDEAAEIRATARAAARAAEERSVTDRASVREQEEAVRSELTHLVRQRDAVLADLTRVRGQLEALLSGPTARITVPAQGAGTAGGRRDAGGGQPLPVAPATPGGGVRIRPSDPAKPTRPGSALTAAVRPAAPDDLFSPAVDPARGGSTPPVSTPPGPASVGPAPAPAVSTRPVTADPAPDAAPSGSSRRPVGEATAGSPTPERPTTERPTTERPADPSPSEQTMVVTPAREQDGSAAVDDHPVGAESTVKVAAAGTYDDDGPSRTEAASASRSG